VFDTNQIKPIRHDGGNMGNVETEGQLLTDILSLSGIIFFLAVAAKTLFDAGLL